MMKTKYFYFVIFVIFISGMSYGWYYPEIEECKEQIQPEWLIVGPYKLPETNAYDTYYFSNIFTQLPDKLYKARQKYQYGDSLNLDFIPTQWKKTEPVFLPYIRWVEYTSPSNRVGYISVHYEGQQLINCHIRSPWHCVRIDGKWKAVTKGIPPGGTNFFLTYNPMERKEEQTNDVITIIVDYFGTNEVPITFTHEYDESTKIDYSQTTWRKVPAIDERPEGLGALREHSLMLLQYCWISPVEQNSELRFGCDDAVKIWQNGVHIHTYPHSRGYRKEKYVIPVNLRKGSNWFQFASINGAGIANFGARLYPSEKPLKYGLQFMDVKSNIRKDEDIKNWQVAGPFYPGCTNVPDHQFCSEVFKQVEYLHYNEDEIETHWRKSSWHERKRYDEMVNLTGLTPEHSVLFLRCNYISHKPGKADLLFGSDDGVRIWHNDKTIYTLDDIRGYQKESDIVEVDLIKGTNTFMFCLVNVVGEGNLGAEIFPREIYDDFSDIVQTGDYVLLDFHWMQAAGEKGFPGISVCPYKPDLSMVRVIDADKNVIYYKEFNGESIKDKRYPMKLSMKNRESGVYTVQSYWDNECHSRSFLYLKGKKQFNDTQRWWVQLLRNDDFFSQSELLKAIGGYATDKEFRNEFSGRIVCAYKANFENELQPYGIVVPEKLKGATNCPLRVILEPRYFDGKEEWSRKFIRGDPEYDYCITVIPYGCGGRIESGIAEKDVLNVINEVKKIFSIDEDRIYLEGECIGGASCWRLAGRYPDMFAGISPRGGVYGIYYRNLLHVPIWNYHGELDQPGLPKHLISLLKSEGSDVKLSINPGAKAGSYDWDVIKEMRKWIETKRKIRHPLHVHYGTYGDIDGAYWVRDIAPERYGMLATIDAVVDTNFANRINVITKNTMKFTLDLTDSLFTNQPEWSVYVDGTGPYSAKSGVKVPIILDECVLEKSPTDLRKKNGFCGGLADLVNDRFIFAYADGEKCGSNRKAAYDAKKNISGIDYWKYDVDIRVVPDTYMTDTLCSNHNVVLFASYECPGMFLKSHMDELPFVVNTNVVTIGGRTGKDFMCLYPNPIVSNRYLLTVMSTNYNERLLQNARFDVVLDRVPGSFDINWDTVQWVDERHNKSGHTHGYDHEKCSDKEPKWKKVGRVIILGIAGCVLVFYGGKKVFERVCR